MQYDAITIDTQIVERNGFHFDSGLLAQLKQFVHGPAEMVISEVIALEITRHLADRTQIAKNDLESAHKKAVQFGLKKHENAAFRKGGLADAQAVSKKRLKKFFKEAGAQIIPAGNVSIDDLIRLYFKSAAPFSASGKKKNEFPDAIALLSLEEWAKAHDKHILAVSGDKDWAAYAKESKYIDVVPELSAALELLQRDAKKAGKIVQKILKDMQSGQRGQLKEKFVRLLGRGVADHTMGAEADSSFDIEAGQVRLTLLDYAFLGEEGSHAVKIVRAGPRKIAARLDLALKVKAQASFSLSVYNFIDKDSIEMGSADIERQAEFNAALLVTFEGNFNANGVEISAVELVEAPKSLHFGYVELNDGGEEDED